MKKYAKIIICLLLAGVLVFTLAGCADKETPPAKEEMPAAEPVDTNVVGAYDEKAADYTLTIDAGKEIRDISDMLYGIFFEDINFAADGGLYAEMVANRSFEFTEIAKDDALYHWNILEGAAAEVSTENALNANNPSCLVITNNGDKPTGVENIGFLEGMAIDDGYYEFSVYAKALDGYKGSMTVRLAVDGESVAEQEIIDLTDEWAKHKLELACGTKADKNVTLQLLIDRGSVAVDMVSLFPKATYKFRENGMRADIAKLLEELHPKFLRFPGGCVIEGTDDISTYDWKASVGADKDGNPLEFNGRYGDVAARRQYINLWTDRSLTNDEWPGFMSYGLGFFEFFQFSEDIGAVGVPVLNAGLHCQGRQGEATEIGTSEFDKYIDDMLDLVEFCRGGEDTEWGKVRVSLGHEKPFELKYICIGNENDGEVYYERYQEFLKAFKKAKAEDPGLYKGIELIYSSGTSDATSGNENYINSFNYAKKQLGSSKNAKDFAGAIDSHYYRDPQWFFDNNDYYDEDNYKRSVDKMTDTNYGGAIQVFLGEYASTTNTMISALAEASYMTGLERNGDIVRMATYAPLLSSVTARHWAPDLIWFNNSGVQPSVNYYMQKLFSDNAGTRLLSSSLGGALRGAEDLTGGVGVGTWLTSAKFDNISVTDLKTGDVLYSEDFSSKSGFKKDWDNLTDAKFKIKKGALVEKASKEEPDKGSVACVSFDGDSNYSYTLDAVKLDGNEGFFIPFAVKNGGNDCFFWNIGGWNNTVSCLQQMRDGAKTGQLPGTVKDIVIETGRTYKLRIDVDGTNIRCYIDGELYVDYDAATTDADAYQVVSTDGSGDIIIKLVNRTDGARTFAVGIENANGIKKSAAVQQVAADSPDAENVFGEKKSAKIEEFDIELQKDADSFNYCVPKYSATVIRISHK
jgi:alpha-L-arabinofuranosidase